MKNNNTYNGWTNYCTWLAALWLNNDEGIYNYFQNISAGLESITDKNEKIKILENAIKEFIENNAPASSTGLHRDLLTYAIDEIDYYEIAVSVLDE